MAHRRAEPFFFEVVRQSILRLGGLLRTALSSSPLPPPPRCRTLQRVLQVLRAGPLPQLQVTRGLRRAYGLHQAVFGLVRVLGGRARLRALCARR